MKPVLVDTGFIVALLDRDERYHLACCDAISEPTQPLVTCEAVITESCYLLRNLPGACEAVLENVEQGVFQLPTHLSESAQAVKNIMHKYRDTPAAFADACLIHLADVVETGEILTLDRHFLSYRWRRTHRFEPLISFRN